MSSSNVVTVEMVLLLQAKDHGDHRNKALARVINLKTWDARMHIALAGYDAVNFDYKADLILAAGKY